ncbi:hypothetical protein E2C01_073222 [Portunus trituberculatus]|uniref:Uncharacterized protein n=1 Tax=Portunus trituberculatus TaxID=210409 RepID=A0A5B7I9A3_PORTR|nr:hypothetical protein [Portunus trituberculatus]
MTGQKSHTKTKVLHIQGRNRATSRRSLSKRPHTCSTCLCCEQEAVQQELQEGGGVGRMDGCMGYWSSAALSLNNNEGIGKKSDRFLTFFLCDVCSSDPSAT